METPSPADAALIAAAEAAIRTTALANCGAETAEGRPWREVLVRKECVAATPPRH